MRRLAVIALAALSSPSVNARAEPANSIRAMFAQLHQCLASSDMRLPQGTDVTIQFMVNRRGELIGKPRVAHAVWGPGQDPGKEAALIAQGFNHCLPFTITDALGGALAGRLIAYRLFLDVPSNEKS
jgi:hypothetical protein